MEKVLIFCLVNLIACYCWPTPLPQVAIAGSSPVNYDALYVLSENQANTNATGSRGGRIGTQIVISAVQPARNLSLEIRMYAVKTADVWHTHTPNEILCVSEGNGVFTSSSGEQWMMAPGDCTLMTGSTSHYFQSYNTNSTSNFTVLTNTFLPAPFQRTDNLTAEQTWTYPTTPLRTTFQEGVLGLSGQASKTLSSYTTSSSLFTASDVSIYLITAMANQVVTNASLPVDTNMLVQKGSVHFNASGMSYTLNAGDYFVLPSNVAVTGVAASDLAILVFNSPSTTQMLTFANQTVSGTTTEVATTSSAVAFSFILSLIVALIASSL